MSFSHFFTQVHNPLNTIFNTQYKNSQFSVCKFLIFTLYNFSASDATNTKIPASVWETWASLSKEVRDALVKSEISSSDTMQSSKSSNTSHSFLSSSSSDNSDTESNNTDPKEAVFYETCPTSGDKVVLQPLERAPLNVFKFEKTHVEHKVIVEKTANSVVTTKTKVVSTGKGWRNVFTLPISYDVNMVAHGTIFDPANSQLLYSTGPPTEGYNRRFAVIDNCVNEIYGDAIRNYFTVQGIELTTCILNGGEAEKRSDAVDKLLDDLCVYKLRRREPFLAIGGGVLLDIAGMAACLYRRGVPFVRVPTTLLAIVDASVGVKNGVDYCCQVTNDTYKNRVGSFYAPSSCLLDNFFITTQDKRNVSNGFGEILKLALVRSTDLFELLESHGAALIESRFAPTASVPNGVSDRIIELSIQIMLEELGPNLWEYKLDRCVDYGKPFCVCT